MSLSIAIIDDQKEHRDHLRDIVLKCEGISHCHSFENPSKLKSHLSAHATDIVFLDIEMNEYNGLEIGREISDKCEIVFVSSYPEYALEGYQSDPLGFIVKPAGKEDVMNILEKLRIRRSRQVNQLTDYYYIRTSSSGLEKITLAEISYIEAKGDYMLFHKNDGHRSACMSLKKLITQLPAHFLQIHRSFLVNLHRIIKIEEHWVYFESGRAPIGRKYRQKLMDHISQHFINR